MKRYIAAAAVALCAIAPALKVKSGKKAVTQKEPGYEEAIKELTDYMEDLKQSILDGTVKTDIGVSKLGRDDDVMLKEKIAGFDYIVESVREDKDRTDISLLIKTFDLGSAYKRTYEKIGRLSEEGAYVSKSHEEMEEIIMSEMMDQFRAADKSYEGKAEVILDKKDGKWEVRPFDMNRIFYGGFFDAVKEL